MPAPRAAPCTPRVGPTATACAHTACGRTAGRKSRQGSWLLALLFFRGAVVALLGGVARAVVRFGEELEGEGGEVVPDRVLARHVLHAVPSEDPLRVLALPSHRPLQRSHHRRCGRGTKKDP